MRRLAVSLGAVIVALGVVIYHAVPAPAISYPAGWNLVSGPEGSHLRGAEGSLYTLQPGGSDYQTLPVDTALEAGWGYWAYFPSGGSLDAAGDSQEYAVTAAPNQWVLIGNPSATVPAAIAGAAEILAYDPVGGYVAATNVAPGQGVWVRAVSEEQPILSVPVQSGVATAPPTPASTAPLPLRSYEGLKSLALSSTDLPAYRLEHEGSVDSYSEFSTASYSGLWIVLDPQSRAAHNIGNMLVTCATEGQAMRLVSGLINHIASNPENTNILRLPVAGLGDEARGISYTWPTVQSHPQAQDYVVVFRRGRVLVFVETGEFAPGEGSLDDAVALARVIDGRLAAVTPAAGAATGNRLPR